jgi:hypothetical protein
MIAILQIGLRRKFNICINNHQSVYQSLSDKYGIKIYDFYKDNTNVPNPFKSPGKIQVYDFMSGCEQINEDVFVKFRSDIYLTDTGKQVLINEIDNVLSHKADVVFLGTNMYNDYKETYKRYDDSRTCKLLNDFVIIARKSKLKSKDLVTEELKHDREGDSGNYYFHKIILPDTCSVNVSTQIYLVRKEFSEPVDTWSVYYNWAYTYVYKATKQHNWIRDNKSVIRGF